MPFLPPQTNSLRYREELNRKSLNRLYCAESMRLQRILFVNVLFIAFIIPVVAQRSSGPPKGILIVDGGGMTDVVVKRFVEQAGGSKASIVVIPTAASSIRFGEQKIILDPDWPRDRSEWKAYEAHLKRWFGI